MKITCKTFKKFFFTCYFYVAVIMICKLTVYVK